MGDKMDIIEIFLKALGNGVNFTIIVIILLLAIIDLIFRKDLKSQIVSLGVLGTFIGIFMGLQDFNPNNMKDSIDTILVGLKTAFFTSIAGMGTALILSIFQKLVYRDVDSSENQGEILLEISNKLNLLNKLDDSKNTDRIIGELERLRSISSDNRDETKKIVISIEQLKENSTKENQQLISILNTNFIKMNHSLEIAIEKLSKGATEEIINALKQVIQEFNQELQTQFGENFVELNKSVINLVEWQNNYKTHIEELEDRLYLSISSIEKSKDSLEIISSKNGEILQVYNELQSIIALYQNQIDRLNKDLETYALLSNNAKKMFSNIEKNMDLTKREFIKLSKIIVETNEEQIYSFEKKSAELNRIAIHFKTMGEEIPKALSISLEELNRGLASLTIQFQKDYKEIMSQYQKGMRP